MDPAINHPVDSSLLFNQLIQNDEKKLNDEREKIISKLQELSTKELSSIIQQATKGKDERGKLGIRRTVQAKRCQIIFDLANPILNAKVNYNKNIIGSLCKDLEKEGEIPIHLLIIKGLQDKSGVLSKDEEDLIQKLNKPVQKTPQEQKVYLILSKIREHLDINEFVLASPFPVESFYKYLENKQIPIDKIKDFKPLAFGFLNHLERNAGSLDRETLINIIDQTVIFMTREELSQDLITLIADAEVPGPSQRAKEIHADAPEKNLNSNQNALSRDVAAPLKVDVLPTNIPVVDPKFISLSSNIFHVGSPDDHVQIEIVAARRKGSEKPSPPKVIGEDFVILTSVRINVNNCEIDVPFTAVLDGGGGHALAQYGHEVLPMRFEEELQFLVDLSGRLTPKLISIAMARAEKHLFENDYYKGQLVRGTAYTEHLFSKHQKLQALVQLDNDTQKNWEKFKQCLSSSPVIKLSLNPMDIYELTNGNFPPTFSLPAIAPKTVNTQGQKLSTDETDWIETNYSQLEEAASLESLQFTPQTKELHLDDKNKNTFSELVRTHKDNGAKVTYYIDETECDLPKALSTNPKKHNIKAHIEHLQFQADKFSKDELIAHYSKLRNDGITIDRIVGQRKLILTEDRPLDRKQMISYIDQLKADKFFEFPVGKDKESSRVYDLTQLDDAKEVQKLYELYRGDYKASRSGITVQSNLNGYMVLDGKVVCVNFNRGDAFCYYSGDLEQDWTPVSEVTTEQKRTGSIQQMNEGGIIIQTCDGHREKLTHNQMRSWDLAYKEHPPESLENYVVDTTQASIAFGGGDDISILGARILR